LRDPGDWEAEESSLESDHRFNAMYMIYAQDPQQDLPLGYIYSIHLVFTQHNHQSKNVQTSSRAVLKTSDLAG
jgi:hypothetical protein